MARFNSQFSNFHFQLPKATPGERDASVYHKASVAERIA